MTSRLDTLKAIIEAWARKDIDQVLGHMDEDIVWHFAAAAEPALVGKAAARKFLQSFGGGLGEITWRIFASAETADRLFVEGVDDYVTAEGVRVAAPYAGVLDFRGDRVIGWRDYVDVGVVAAQRAGKPMTDQVKALIAREPI